MTNADSGWGDPLKQKQPNTIWLLLQNIRGINLTETGSLKLAALREYANQAQVDIIALTECNAAWDKVQHKLLPREQTKFWWENLQWSTACNCHKPHHEAYQTGSTALVILNPLGSETR